MNDKWANTLRITIQVILLLLIIAYGISGYGISESRTVQTMTFGLISKPLAFQLHDSLLIPFAIFLLLHIFFRPLYKLFRKTGK
jgi:cytochrome b561